MVQQPVEQQTVNVGVFIENWTNDELVKCPYREATKGVRIPFNVALTVAMNDGSFDKYMSRTPKAAQDGLVKMIERAKEVAMLGVSRLEPSADLDSLWNVWKLCKLEKYHYIKLKQCKSTTRKNGSRYILKAISRAFCDIVANVSPVLQTCWHYSLEDQEIYDSETLLGARSSLKQGLRCG